MTDSTPPIDVGDVIARAAELKQKSEDQLTPEQLREVAADLGIEARFVDDAVKDLDRRHRANAALAARKKARTKKLIAAFVAVDIGVVVVLALAVSSAKSEWQHVEGARAAVASSLVRQQETEKLFGARKGEREADAELAGAGNRTAIAKKRYDEAAVVWNGRGVFTGIGAGLAGLDDAPLSTDRATW